MVDHVSLLTIIQNFFGDDAKEARSRDCGIFKRPAAPTQLPSDRSFSAMTDASGFLRPYSLSPIAALFDAALGTEGV